MILKGILVISNLHPKGINDVKDLLYINVFILNLKKHVQRNNSFFGLYLKRFTGIVG